MRRVSVVLLAVLAALAAGCGSKTEPADSSSSAPPSSAAGGSASMPAVSKYDAGPRAIEGALDEELAEQGEKLFQGKGCSACHTFGKKMSGPDLQGVTARRTAVWMENQILHPEVMVKEDPIARKLFGEMALQMPNQGLKPEEARAVIEYLKKKDVEAGLGSAK